MLRHPSLIPLSHQHHDALALCVLVERGLPEDAPSEKAAELARKTAGLFELELRNHFDLEERLLFPLISHHLGPTPLVDELVAEHRRLETMAGRLGNPGPELRAALLDFTAALRRHVRREEDELFEDVQKRLPEETLEQLGRSLKAEAVRICL